MTIQEEIDKLTAGISSRLAVIKAGKPPQASKRFLTANVEDERKITELKARLSITKPAIISKPTLAGPVANPPETIRPKMDSLSKGVGTSTPQKGLSNTTKALIVGGVGLVLFG